MRTDWDIPIGLLVKSALLFSVLLLPLWPFAGPNVAGQASSPSVVPRGGTSSTRQESMSAEQVARIMAEAPGTAWHDSLQLSPDGAWVVYCVVLRSLASNESKIECRLQRVPRDGEAVSDPLRLPDNASAVRWCPDSRCLSMTVEDKAADAKGAHTFVRYDIATGKMTPFPLRDTFTTAGSPGARPRITTVGANYQWSPRGSYVAFTAPLGSSGGLDRRRGVSSSQWVKRSRYGLFMLEVGTGNVTQLTADSLTGVQGFSWAPDESALAVTVVGEGHSNTTGSDLFVVKRVSGAVRELVARPGMDANPNWSPDGRLIAFATHNGELAYGAAGWPAVVPAAGGPITTFPKDGTPMTMTGGEWWSRDSDSFYYESGSEMTNQLVSADVKTSKATSVPGPSGLELFSDNSRSVSKDGRLLAYVRESSTAPLEVFVVALGADGQPNGTPRQLTRLSQDFQLGKLVRTQEVSWPSPDGKFTIHSLLFTPASAWSGNRVNAPLPTLVFHTGGPSMVTRDFARDGFGGALLALAARGYAILVPNTRGRGGYGEKLKKAFRDEKNRALGPYQDSMAGVDFLIKRGIADPDKLGVLGHSYGGYMTAYAITQTTRFKAAVVHEGDPLSLMDSLYIGYPLGGLDELLQRDLFGIHNPFDETERTRMIAESPLLNVDRVKTPTLLQYGGRGKATDEGQPFFNALQRYKVPSALFVYDEGHTFNRPAAIADDLTRTGEWLDYWVRGIPYPNAERAAEYNSWRKTDENTAVQRRSAMRE